MRDIVKRTGLPSAVVDAQLDRLVCYGYLSLAPDGGYCLSQLILGEITATAIRGTNTRSRRFGVIHDDPAAA